MDPIGIALILASLVLDAGIINVQVKAGER
jgi:hypothetical protein